MAGPSPIGVRIRMYQVGFGDCFLVTFEYAQPLADGRAERHILIDYGTMANGGGFRDLKTVGRLIREHTKGEIDVVVATHRHRDHISGFGSKEIANKLVVAGYPKLVVRSWTEDPGLDRAATGPAAPAIRGATATAGNGRSSEVGKKSLDFIATLAAASDFTRTFVKKTSKPPRNSLAADAVRLADDQMSNEEAVTQLKVWGDASKPVYLHYGMRSGIESIVPGITTRVLGPPTIDQYPAVATMRDEDPKEFWMIYDQVVGKLTRTDLLGRAHPTQDGHSVAAARNAPPDDVSGVAPDPAETEAPDTAHAFGPVGPVRWLTDRMGRQQLNSLYRIVRILDGVLNNTSVILLIDVGTGKEPLRLLFGGDAQIENWEYALKKPTNRALLRGVDIYKVGHHGSRNATPRTLFNLWQEPKTKDREMWALMSTKAGIHGDFPETAVPRETLVAALDTRMKLRSTAEIVDRTPYVEIHVDVTNGKKVTEVPIDPIKTTAKKPANG
jgi:hypothetical protein